MWACALALKLPVTMTTNCRYAHHSSASHWPPDTTLSPLDQIERLFVFENFVDAMIFVNKVAEIAEEDSHHPDIRILYNRVTFTLSTHDAGGLTQKDFQMAHRIDSVGG